MLQFNKERFLKEFIADLSFELTIVADTLIQKMANIIDMIPYSGSPAAVGKPDWRSDVINALNYRIIFAANNILLDVGIIEQADDTIMKAMIVNFGMGIMSDNDNPWLAEYMSSEFYHSERNGMRVYGRKGKNVYDIDTNSWKPSTAKHDKEIKRFRQKGSGFWGEVFGEDSELIISHVSAAIDRVIISIDFSKYIEQK